jgi:hypothetical protein
VFLIFEIFDLSYYLVFLSILVGIITQWFLVEDYGGWEGFHRKKIFKTSVLFVSVSIVVIENFDSKIYDETVLTNILF